MRAKHNATLETRRLYAFERTFGPALEHPYAQRERSLAFLKRLAARVWAKYGRAGCKPPSIAFDANAKTSVCIGRCSITLSTSGKSPGGFKHNTVDVLLHELTHAMGFGAPHGPAFVRRYVKLLVEFGKCEEGKLLLGLAMAKVKV